MKKSKLFKLILLWAFLSFFLDQISKFWFLALGWPIYFNNESIVFGLIPIGVVGLILVGILQVGTAFWFYSRLKKDGSSLGEIGLGLFIGGSLGNKIDRLFRGGAVDWIDIKVWPIFNLADIAIVAGLFLMVYHIQRRYHEPKNISS